MDDVPLAYSASPFEESVILPIKGYGDFTVLMVTVGKGNQKEVSDAVHVPVSTRLF